MLKNRARNERWLKRVGIFIGMVFLSILAFYLISALLNTDGDEGILVVMSFVISLQISFVTAYVISNSKK
jgi:hypothetical protein